ncbi:hypothetical protein RhiirA5_441139, partial [Rhizophagus irregularis]
MPVRYIAHHIQLICTDGKTNIGTFIKVKDSEDMMQFNYYKKHESCINIDIFAFNNYISDYDMIFYKKLYYKKKIRAISDEVKRQICEWGKANKNKHHVDIANHFNEV